MWVFIANLVDVCADDVRLSFYMIEYENWEYMARYEVRSTFTQRIQCLTDTQTTKDVELIRMLVSRLLY